MGRLEFSREPGNCDIKIFKGDDLIDCDITVSEVDISSGYTFQSTIISIDETKLADIEVTQDAINKQILHLFASRDDLKDVPSKAYWNFGWINPDGYQETQIKGNFNILPKSQ